MPGRVMAGDGSGDFAVDPGHHTMMSMARSVTAVPEPSVLTLLLAAGLGVIGFQMRRWGRARG